MSDGERVHIYFYLNKLYSGDVVKDGESGAEKSIESDTMFVWVDPSAGLPFAHETRYLFITSSSTDVVNGSWWPLINGKKHFAPYVEAVGPSFVEPFFLGQNTAIYAFPYALTSEDKLTDGAEGQEISLYEETLLLWVDHYKQSNMPHDTRYVLVSRSGVRVEKGQWWPVLNGRAVRFEHVHAAVPSPFVLTVGG